MAIAASITSTRATSLRYKLRFQRRSGTRSASDGGQDDSWVDAFSSPIPGARLDMFRNFVADEGVIDSVHSSSLHSYWRIRWKAGIKLDMRFICDDVTYRIQTLAPVKHRQWIDLIAVQWGVDS